MVGTLAPEDVVVTINGSNYTTQLFNFTESGGEKNVSTTKTLGRKYKNTRGTPEDYGIGFSATVTGSSLETLFTNTGSFSLSLAWSGSATITYNSCEVQNMNYSMGADDRLVAEISLFAPFYTFNGSLNRVVS